MSYFIFGKTKLNDEKASLEKFCTDSLIKALNHGLNIFWSFNIPQDIVHKMIGDLKKDELSFLITPTPLHDTSDLLISPYSYNPENESNKDNIHIQDFKNLSILFSSLLKNEIVVSIDLYIADGFEDKFIDVDVNVLDNLEQILSEAYSKDDDLSGYKFIIDKT